jgi:hypothetical protein
VQTHPDSETARSWPLNAASLREAVSVCLLQPMDPLKRVRLWLLAVLVISILGTGIELLLLEHIEGFWQKAPLVMLAVGVVLGLAAGAQPNPMTLRLLQLLMLVFVIAGVWGTWLHYTGNVEFELEMSPAMKGWELFRAAMMGATPALAPGTMSQLGLIGLLYTYRHPALRKDSQ